MDHHTSIVRAKPVKAAHGSLERLLCSSAAKDVPERKDRTEVIGCTVQPTRAFTPAPLHVDVARSSANNVDRNARYVPTEK